MAVGRLSEEKIKGCRDSWGTKSAFGERQTLKMEMEMAAALSFAPAAYKTGSKQLNVLLNVS